MMIIICHVILKVVVIFNQGEIDAREDSFRATAEAGQKLLESKHYAIEEVKEKVIIPINLQFRVSDYGLHAMDSDSD